MGTVYRIVLPGTEEERLMEIRGKIRDLLKEINSELSVLNPKAGLPGSTKCPQVRFCVFPHVFRKSCVLHAKCIT